MPFSRESCAAELLDVVPLLMRAMRAEVRRQRAPELSIPQFRALAFVGRNQGAALSDVAAFLGLTAPSASKLIDGLVAAKFVGRKVDPGDRRRVSLALSPAGSDRFEAARQSARDYFAGRIQHLGPARRRQLVMALRDLREAFAQDTPPEVAAKNGERSRAKRKTRRVTRRDRRHA